ncbi:hypothetical protein DL765_000454 [Monosporascus sp. GIB2]|nr:hypothetical protein DL765_000454 [Monosporascus sp. GIB2]
MRQGGASLDHNGMLFFPATILEGVSMSHGTCEAEAIAGTEWLAFGIEHAEIFASFQSLSSPSRQSLEGIGYSDHAAQAVIAVEDKAITYELSSHLPHHKASAPALYGRWLSGGGSAASSASRPASRYANRLRFMAEKASLDELRFEVDSLLDTFIDYSAPHPNMTAAFDRGSYLAICGSLFALSGDSAAESAGKDWGLVGQSSSRHFRSHAIATGA